MKKILTIIISLALVLSTFGFVSADPLADPNDVFNVVAPGPNSRVSGVVNVSWYMYDNNQNVIPYTVNLFDPATCETNNYGQINSSPTGVSSQTQLNTIQWNTRTTSSTSNLTDGNYCVRVCLAMKNGANNYSACNGRIVRIINNNRPPVITSLPTNLVIKETDSWQYQITATDPDNNPIVYRLVQAPNFLTINQQTGLVTTNSSSKALPSGVNRADYSVIVSADDNFYGAVNQQFILSIIRTTPAVAPPPATPTPIVPPAQQNKPSEISITFPKEGDVLGGKENKLTWSVKDDDGIRKVLLSYSNDGETWTDITNFENEPIPTEYIWDVSEIPNGEYYLRFTVQDSTGIQVSKISKKFVIKNDEETPIVPESKPLIINVKPLNNSEITERRPDISGEFVLVNDVAIRKDEFVLKINDVDLSSTCEVRELDFTCTLSEDLPIGANKVLVEITDSVDKKASNEWTFTIQNGSLVSSPVVPNVPEEERTVIIAGREIPVNTLTIVVSICCLAGLIFLIPLLLYMIWSRRNREDRTVFTEVETTTTPETTSFDTSYITPPPDITANYYTPENYNYTDYSYKSGTETAPVVETTTQPIANSYDYTVETQAPVVSEPVVEPVQEVTPTVEVQPQVVEPVIEEPVQAPVVAEPVIEVPPEPALPEPVVPPAPAPEPVQPPVQPQPAQPQTAQQYTDYSNTATALPDYNLNDYYSYVAPGTDATKLADQNTNAPTQPAAGTPTPSSDSGFVEPTETDK